MASHVDRDHVVILLIAPGDVIECVRRPRNAVQHDERRLALVAPVQEVNPQAVDGDEAVDAHCCRLECGRRPAARPHAGRDQRDRGTDDEPATPATHANAVILHG
jgi:hypothetical protein